MITEFILDENMLTNFTIFSSEKIFIYNLLVRKKIKINAKCNMIDKIFIKYLRKAIWLTKVYEGVIFTEYKNNV